ncbi:MAG: GNAT family N-acetyltransferase [Prevotella sp.]|jgi:diamine N-acetyltransferase
MKKTPQITLRAIEPEDLDSLYLIENDQDLWDVGITNVPYSRFALHEYLVNASGDIYVDRQVRLVICDEEGQTVGLVDLTNFNPRHNRAEVGIVIQKAYRDQGYGAAAIRQLIVYARRILHLRQMYALVSVKNEKCVKIFEEVGFQRNAELVDWLYDGEHYVNAIVMQCFLKNNCE